METRVGVGLVTEKVVEVISKVMQTEEGDGTFIFIIPATMCKVHAKFHGQKKKDSSKFIGVLNLGHAFNLSKGTLTVY